MQIMALTLLMFLPTAVSAHTGNGPETHTVVIRQMHFDPPQIAVHPGDIVEWKNQDIFSHTITANDGSFDSGLVAPGQSWKTTVAEPGTVGYHCTPHPNMTASLVISGGEAGTAQPAGAGSQSLRWRFPSSPEQFHPILVNFTAALLPLALLFDVLGRMLRQQSLHHAAWWLVAFEAIITPFTAAAGWWWKHAQGASALPPRLIMVHQWLGTAAALLFIVLAAWRWNIHKRGATPGAAYLGFALIAVLALVYQGSLGGAMVFGK